MLSFQHFPQTSDHDTTVHQQTTSSSTIVPTSVDNDASPIWGLLSSRMSPEEEQWPDLTVSEPQSTQGPNLEEMMKYKLKMAEQEEERCVQHDTCTCTL